MSVVQADVMIMDDEKKKIKTAYMVLAAEITALISP